MNGGDGRDSVDYSLRGEAVTVSFDDVANDGRRGEADGVARDVEIVLGSPAPDTLTGDGRGTSLDGGSGEDLVDGGAGTDQLTGGTGGDVLRARDGARDVVSCGQESDLVIADVDDVVRDCELVDRGRRRRARLGEDVLLSTIRGSNRFRLPEGERFFSLAGRIPLPVGGAVDSRGGTVSLLAAADRRGSRSSAKFRGGAFAIKQSRRDRVMEARLIGGSFRACPRAKRSRATTAAKRRVRRLWGSTGGRHANVRTRGRYSAATVRGTKWLVADRCDGTLTRALSGHVVVEDFVGKRRVRLRAGQSYLARPRRLR
jgi:hypothetical protein